MAYSTSSYDSATLIPALPSPCLHEGGSNAPLTRPTSTKRPLATHNDSDAPKKAKKDVLRASETIPTPTGASQTDAGEPVAIHKKVAFASGKENVSAAEAPPLKKMKALIPAPKERGAGWLIRHMRLEKNKLVYNNIRYQVKTCISRVSIDLWEQPFDAVDPGDVARAKQEIPYLRRFENDWAAYELVKSSLTNSYKYLLQRERRQLGRARQQEMEDRATMMAFIVQLDGPQLRRLAETFEV